MEGLSQFIDQDGDRDLGSLGLEPVDPDHNEDDGDVPPATLTRSVAFAVKRPYFPDVESDDSSDDATPARPRLVPVDDGGKAFVVDYANGPDLDGYFDCFGLPVRDRVLLCRSYASYLVAKGQSGIRRPGPKAGFKAPRRV